jgi:hypothetical protein
LICGRQTAVRSRLWPASRWPNPLFTAKSNRAQSFDPANAACTHQSRPAP